MIYAFGAYELDTRIYEIRNRGKVRPVEPQVFDVLAYLVANRDRVVSKEELLEKLWPDRFVSEATLTSRLKEARKAVGDDGRAQSIIRTHHGRGYRFVAEVEERAGPSVHGFTAVSGDYEVRPTLFAEASSAGARGDEHSHGMFVGRGSELALLEDTLTCALRGERRIVFVAGEAGAGKTTLVERFIARQAASPLLVARGQCVEHRGSGEPYMPLLDAIGRLCRTSEGGEIIELLRREAPSWLLQMPWLMAEEERDAVANAGAGERMLRELGMALERLTERRPLVLLLEDLHWSDYATLEAVDLLARQTHPARLLIVGTFRPDVKAARHPVYAIAQELRARGHCALISLPLLKPSDFEEYLRARFPKSDFTEVGSLLHERTSGNALFLTNLVDSWVSRGFIVERDGRWSLHAPLQTLTTDVPESLQQLIEKEIAAADPDLQRLLETASVVGREFTVAILAVTLAVDDDEVERRCELLARQGSFIREAGSEHWGDGAITARFCFIHDLYVDVVYQRIPAARAARLHQQIGLALERAWQGREREHGAELALHFQRAPDRERALRYLELAAEQAIDRSAYREAVLHLSKAIQLIERQPRSSERDTRELSVRSRLAPALVATRGWADPSAEKNYLRAIELARASGNGSLLSQMLYGAATMYEYRGEYRKAERIANERLALEGQPSPMSSVESHELLACSMLHQGRYQEAIEHGGRALTAAIQNSGGVFNLGMVVLLVQAHGWMSGALVFAGRADEALDHGDRAIELARRSGDDLAKASAFIQASFVRFYRGEMDECDELARAGSEIARERRFPFHVACGRILNGWCLAQHGDVGAGEREIRGGIRTSVAIGSRMDVPLFHTILADCLRAGGDVDGALHALDDAFALVNRNRSFFYLPDIYRLAGDILIERGDVETGLRAVWRALTLADEQQSPLFALRAATTLARIEASDESRLRLRTIFESFTQALDTRDLNAARALLAHDRHSDS